MPEVAQPTPASKVCAFCGTDVASQPRVKDAQGRYACIPCAERAQHARAAQTAKPEPPPIKVQAAKAAAPATADGVDPILNDLLASSITAKKVACTSCGYLVDPEAKVCAHCGFDKDTGRVHRTVFIKAPKEKVTKEEAASRLSNPMVYYASSVVTGAISGAIGAGIWAYMVNALRGEIRYMAIVVGLLTGTGAYLGARGFSNPLTGLYAGLLCCVAMIAGRYFGIVSIYGSEIGSFTDVFPYLLTPMFVIWALVGAFAAYKIGSSGFEASL